MSVVIPEADALGCNTLAPAYRSFPEVYENDSTRMYIPWSIEDAIAKLNVMSQHKNVGRISKQQSTSIERTLHAISYVLRGYDFGIDPSETAYRQYGTRIPDES